MISRRVALSGDQSNQFCKLIMIISESRLILGGDVFCRRKHCWSFAAEHIRRTRELADEGGVAGGGACNKVTITNYLTWNLNERIIVISFTGGRK